MTDITPDSVYQLIKSMEGSFSPPAPYFTVNVGVLDVDTGAFTGLTTEQETDPEPLPHGPHDHPTNRPGRFVGEEWLVVTVGANWHATFTRTPAPKVPLAPVRLSFSVTRPVPGGWNVLANGARATAGPADTELTVDVWDARTVGWTIQAGGLSHSDTLMIQRPAGVPGLAVGAFTIPALPLTLVYAPPADASGRSAASYAQGQTIGNSVTFDSSQDTSQTVPAQDTAFGGVGTFAQGLNFIAGKLGDKSFLGLGASATIPTDITAAAGILSGIATQLGKVTNTVTTGETDDYQSQLTITTTTSTTVATSTTAGGPGVGDMMHYCHDLLMAWCYFAGRLRLCPLGYKEAVLPVSALAQGTATIGLSGGDAQALQALVRFIAGGAGATPPLDRFVEMSTYEYGYGAQIQVAQTTTRDTKFQTTETSYTTKTDSWDPGPILKGLLGLGETDQTTLKVSNAVGQDVSTTITLSATLASGPADYFVVTLWYDELLGTFAFQTLQPAATPRLQGTDAQPDQEVTLAVGGRTFITVADRDGRYAFYAPTIGEGEAELALSGQPARPILIGPAVDAPA